MNAKIGAVSLYFADASELCDEGLYAELYAAASPYRKQKADRYLFRKDKNLSLCAEYLLGCGCRDFGIDLKEQKIALGDRGKPYFEGGGLHFSLSHSHERAMCAVARFELGCDVEKLRSFDAAVASHTCSQEELIALENCGTAEEKSLLFYRLWTLKESFIKCTGEGISVPLKSICFIKNGEIIKTYSVDGKDYFLFGGNLDGEYSYALCVQGGAAYETVREQIRVVRKSAIESKQLSEDLQ